MPLTASKTEADTSATTRLVTFGAVPAVRTVVFMTPIHSSTGSGVAADTGRGLAASSATIGIRIALRMIVPTLRRPSNKREPGLNPYFLLPIMFPPRKSRYHCNWLVGQSAMTWQIARQQECATVWCQLAESSDQSARYWFGRSMVGDPFGSLASASWTRRRRSARCIERQSKAKWGARANFRLLRQL